MLVTPARTTAALNPSRNLRKRFIYVPPLAAQARGRHIESKSRLLEDDAAVNQNRNEYYRISAIVCGYDDCSDTARLTAVETPPPAKPDDSGGASVLSRK
jgi:hypothetical protein